MITKATKEFSQEPDCCDDSCVGSQDIVIQQDDGGGGPFWIIATPRWAISSIAEFVKLLREAGVAETDPEATP